MSLFGSKVQSYLGIDLGSSSIKMVELSNEKGRPRLLTYGYSEHSADIIRGDSAQNKEIAVSYLKQILSAAKASSKTVVAALPTFAVFSSVIDLPQMDKKELVSAVQWEAKKFVPMPLEEMILDWKILSGEVTRYFAPVNNRGSIGGMKILLTAAPKQLVQRYVEIFKASGLQLASLETESFALERALVGNDKSPIMIVDVGAMATDITIIVGGIPLLNRSIDIGGNAITKTIANKLGIDMDRAEQFKQDFGIQMSSESPQASRVPETIQFATTAIINEVKHLIKLYKIQSNQPLEKIILSGGSAFLPNFPEYISQTLEIKAYIGDPWARIVYPVELKSVLRELGPKLAVAVGLGMREII